MTEEKTKLSLFPKQGDRFTYKINRLGAAFDVRLPSDDEWRAYQRRVGNLTDEDAIIKAGAELCRVVCANPPEDDGEATLVLGKLLNAEPDDTDYLDGKLIVTVDGFPGRPTIHTMKVPTLKQETKIRKLAQENRMASASMIEIYEDLLIEATGYAGAPPAWHMRMTLFQVLAGLRVVDSGDSVEDAENFTQ